MLYIQSYMLCSLLTIFPLAQAEKCEDAFPAPQPSTVSYNARDIASRNRNRMSFEEAKTFIQNQAFKTVREFQKWSKSDQRPENFPSTPNRTYKDQWTGWGDFLGTKNTSRKRKQMSFESAKTFIQKKAFKTVQEFHKWSQSGQRPKNFPSSPNIFYKDQWTSWGEFLGTGNIANQNREWMSYQEAKTFIQKQAFKTVQEFRKWSSSGQRPTNFPSTPNDVYKDQWVSWDYFLSTGNIANRNKKWMSYQEARTFIQKQAFKTVQEFRKWSSSGQKPENFPSHPNSAYKDQWTDWGDFLGTGTIAHNNKEWMSYQEAKTFIQNLIITSKEQFQKWSKSGQKPENFPSHPDRTYKDQWTSWGDFLSTGTIAHKNKEWMSYQEAKTFIQTQGIQTSREFRKWIQSDQRPENFPSTPYKVYRSQWTGWGDFLGTRNTANRKQEWMSYQEARTFIQNQGIQTSTEFHKWSASDQRPENFPSTPNVTYKDQWTSWSDFLGTENISTKSRNRMSYRETKNFIQNQGVQTRTKWMSYQEAVSFIQKQGIRTHTEFLKWSKSDQRPENFPSNPHIVYKDQWTSWGEFLGNKNLPIQMQYLEAKEYVQSLGINNPKDFIEWLRSDDRPENFPLQPHLFYSEWINSKDFLSAPEKTKYMSYQEAKAFISYLGITTARGFFEMMKFEPDIFPKNFSPNPQTVYKNSGEWTNWNDFLDPIDKDQSTINEPIESPELEESFVPAMDLIDEIDL